jgi:VIT1/CCC1 family predicted Fe2+/Mn2+ transporter
MNPAGQVLGILLALGGLFGVGYLAGNSANAEAHKEQVDALTVKVDNANATAKAERDRADGNAGALLSMRSTMATERQRRADQQRAADIELGARDARIKELTRAAQARADETRTKALADEDCTVLRTLPVCSALAERLWGDAWDDQATPAGPN